MKNLIYILFTLIILAPILVSCCKWGYKKVDDVEEVEIPCADMADKEYIINDDSAYYKILDIKKL